MPGSLTKAPPEMPRADDAGEHPGSRGGEHGRYLEPVDNRRGQEITGLGGRVDQRTDDGSDRVIGDHRGAAFGGRATVRLTQLGVARVALEPIGESGDIRR